MAFYAVYEIGVENIGVTYDLIAGCSLWGGTVPEGAPALSFHWFKIPNFPSGASATIKIATYFPGYLPEGDYVTRARLWSGHSGGTKIGDLTDPEGTVLGYVYQAGTGTLLKPIINQMDYGWSKSIQLQITSLNVYEVPA